MITQTKKSLHKIIKGTPYLSNRNKQILLYYFESREKIIIDACYILGIILLLWLIIEHLHIVIFLSLLAIAMYICWRNVEY